MSAAASLTHLPFFEALAAETDDASPAWRRLSAGLVVLRAFDGWLRHVRRGDPPLEMTRLRAARALADAVDTAATERPVLVGLADAMLAPGGRTEVVRGHLLAYARRLQLDARWRLAADVYRTFVESRDPTDVSVDAIEGAFQCGYCYRMDGDVEEAAIAYDLGEALAIAAGDRYGMLRARVCQAKIVAQRGNLPAAEQALDAVIRDAEVAGERRALALALTDRMAVAGRRGQFEAAATFGYRALQLTDDDLTREPILADIATALGDSGHHDAARDVHLVLAETAREPRVRGLARVNLLVAAGRDGDELAFERYRRQLTEVPLPADLQAHVQLAVGDGRAGFGQLHAAAAAYRAALEVAERHQLNELIIRAESSLAALRSREGTRVAAPQEPGTVTIDEVIGAMRTLRESLATTR